MKVLPDLLVLLARRLLEAAHVLLALLSTGTDQRAIRDLVLFDEAREKMKAEAEDDALVESMLVIEKDRAAAVEIGRRDGAGSGRRRSRTSPWPARCGRGWRDTWSLSTWCRSSPGHARCVRDDAGERALAVSLLGHALPPRRTELRLLTVLLLCIDRETWRLRVSS